MARRASMPGSSRCWATGTPRRARSATWRSQEERHRAFFDRMIVARGVRPTIAPAVLDRRRLRARRGDRCASVPMRRWPAPPRSRPRSTSIMPSSWSNWATDDPELSAAIADFQAEELEHRDHALAAGAENTPGYPVLSAAIRLGCKVAIAAPRRGSDDAYMRACFRDRPSRRRCPRAAQQAALPGVIQKRSSRRKAPAKCRQTRAGQRRARPLRQRTLPHRPRRATRSSCANVAVRRNSSACRRNCATSRSRRRIRVLGGEAEGDSWPRAADPVRTATGSCSVNGAGGQTGCLRRTQIAASRAANAERKAAQSEGK